MNPVDHSSRARGRDERRSCEEQLRAEAQAKKKWVLFPLSAPISPPSLLFCSLLMALRKEARPSRDPTVGIAGENKHRKLVEPKHNCTHDTHYCCYNLLKITTKFSQRRATKFVSENWWWLWKKSNLLSLQDRSFLFDALFFYNGFTNIDISPFFTFNRILIGTPCGVGILVYLRRIMLRQTFSNFAFF